MSTVNYTANSHLRAPEMRNINYSQALHDKGDGKLLLVLPDDPDTSRSYYQNLLDYFYHHSYHIIIVAKPGDDSFKKRLLDTREDRIEDVVSLLSARDSLYHQDLILLGTGQGAYLIPALSKRMKASHLIMINAGVLSPMAELEYITTADSLSAANEHLLNLYGLDKLYLSQKLENIKKEPFGADQLAPSSNRNWLSYYESPVLNQLSGTNTSLYWYNFSDYPATSVTGLALLEQIAAGYPNINYMLLKKQTAADEMKSALKQMISKH